MFKKLFSLVFVLIFCLSFSIFGFAQGTEFIFDFEDVVSDEESLKILAQEIYDQHGIAIVYIRTKSLEGLTGAEYAQQQYTRHVSCQNAVVLVDCAEASSYYMHYAGTAKAILSPEMETS